MRKLLDAIAVELHQTTSDQVLSEPTSIEREYNTFWDTFVASMLSAYLLGLGGVGHFDDSAKVTFNDFLRDQLSYYTGFGQAILAGNLSLAQIADRFRLYAQANRRAYEQGRLAAYGLRLYPTPGNGTECGNNCKCWLNIREFRDRWEVRWVRTAKESCTDCIYYGTNWQPYTVYK